MWYSNTSSESLFIEESCSGLFCTPYCKSLVTLLSTYTSYSEWWEWLVLAVSLLLVYGPILPKTLLYVQQRWLFWQQRKYIRTSTAKRLCRQGTIFTSISCMGLSYKVTNSRLKAAKDAVCFLKTKLCMRGTAVEDIADQDHHNECGSVK